MEKRLHFLLSLFIIILHNKAVSPPSFWADRIKKNPLNTNNEYIIIVLLPL